VQGTRDIIYLIDRMEKPADVRSVVNFVLSDDQRTKIKVSPTEFVDFIPSRKFSLPAGQAIDPETDPETGREAMAVEWEINRHYITKSGLALLDLLAENNWERPVYFAITMPSSEYLGLDDYFQLEGLAYRLIPFKKSESDGYTGHVNTEIMYRNMMESFRWGNINDESVYLDETNLRMISNMRSIFGRLASSLIAEGRPDKAVRVLDRAMEIMPRETVPFDYFVVPLVRNYYLAGKPEKAGPIALQKAEQLNGELNYYISLNRMRMQLVEPDIHQAMAIYNELIKAVSGHDPGLELELTANFNSYYQLLSETMSLF
jgi:hypothetical protein